MKAKQIIFFSFLVIVFNCHSLVKPDLSIVGRLLFADGLGRIPILWIDALKNEFDINFFESHPHGIYLKDLPSEVKKIAYSSNKTPGKVGIYFDLLWDKYTNSECNMPNCNIKFAYSMLESSEIPDIWVDRINKLFDGVIVPDEFLIDVYKKSGVKKPIFVLPIAMYLADFLRIPSKSKKNRIFVFGSSAVFVPRKNQEMIIDAFAKVFGNDKRFMLKLHARGSEEDYLRKIKKTIQRYGLKNVQIILSSISQSEYINFMKSLDCYIFVSKGEGYSLTPREALAAGVPVIISNNSSHKHICDSGLVKCLDCPTLEPAYYPIFNQQCGYHWNIRGKDLQNAMVDVFNNYESYLKNAIRARKWIQKYDFKTLLPFMKSIVRPQKIILGNKNIIEPNCVITDSPELFEKYNHI